MILPSGVQPGFSELEVVEPPAQEPGRSQAHQGLRRLFQIVFHHEVSEATWAWKYHQAPRSRAFHLAVLDERGWDDPCGHVGCLVMPGHWQSRPCWMAHLTDVMVHPRARGSMERSTVYARLMRAMALRLSRLEGATVLQSSHAAKGSDDRPLLFAYGFPGHIPSRLGQRMGLYRPLLGPSSASQAQPVWTHDTTADHENQPHFGFRGLISDLASFIAKSATPGVRRVNPIHTDADLHRLVEAAPRAGVSGAQPAVEKSADYLQWRYRRHPQRTYRLWSIESGGGRPVGWLVTGEGDHEGWVIDSSLPQAMANPSGWAAVLRELGRASGRTEWKSWRAAAGPGHSCIASLIVPGEFRVWSLVGQPEPVRPNESPQPAFHPGDTDVF